MLNTDDNKKRLSSRLIGWSLLGLSILANLAMAHHPYITVSDPQGKIEQMTQIAPLTTYVHGVLMLVVLAYMWLFTLYGALKNTPINWLGSGVFVVGGLALLGAALISGFLSPALMLDTKINTPEQLAIFKFQSHLMWQSNQIMANAGTLAWLCALICWSSTMLRDDKLTRWVGLIGLVIGSAGLLGIITGKWHLNVKGMSLIVLATTTWFCALAGCLLWNTRLQTHQ